MLGTIAKIRVKEGANEGFENVARQLQEAVNANEPGCSLYAVHKDAEDPQLYIFMERYEDEAAVEAHRKSDHFRSLGRAMGEFMDGRPELLRMTSI